MGSANHIPLSHRNLINNQKSTAFQPKSNISRQLPHFYIDHHISLHNVFHILSTTITLLSSPSQEYDIESSFTLSAYTREMHQHTKKQMEAASRSARRRSANADGTNAHGRLDQSGSVSSMDGNQSS